MRLIGLDIGTSSTKAIAIDGDGNIVAQASASYPLSQPNPGWFEQDPSDWWAAAQKCLAEVDAKSSDAIGITGQMHGSVFLDSKGKVIRPALLWNDSRTVAECSEIEKKVGAKRYQQITFNQPVPGLQLPKILWMKQFEPKLFAKVDKVLLPKDYVAFKATNCMRTDPHDASGTGCFGLVSKNWSPEILSAVGLGLEMFPNVVESSKPSGEWSDIPVFLAGGDQGANGVGTGVVDSETVGLALGSSGVIFAVLKKPRIHRTGMLNCFCNVPGGYHAMAVTQNCGTALSAASQAYFDGISSQELGRLANTPKSYSKVLFAPLFSGERCPVRCPNPIPVFEGRTESDSSAVLARAVFESISFMLRHGFDQLTEICQSPSRIVVSGGGSASKFWVQMLADLFRLPISILPTSDGPAFGAALTAGVGIGAWQSLREAAKTVRVTSIVEPIANPHIQAKYLMWRKWMDTAPFVKE
jgi:xylulokinase